MITTDYVDWGNAIGQNPMVSDICFGIIEEAYPCKAIAGYLIDEETMTKVFESKADVLEFINGDQQIHLSTILQNEGKLYVKFTYTK